MARTGEQEPNRMMMIITINSLGKYTLHTISSDKVEQGCLVKPGSPIPILLLFLHNILQLTVKASLLCRHLLCLINLKVLIRRGLLLYFRHLLPLPLRFMAADSLLQLDNRHIGEVE